MELSVRHDTIKRAYYIEGKLQRVIAVTIDVNLGEVLNFSFNLETVKPRFYQKNFDVSRDLRLKSEQEEVT